MEELIGLLGRGSLLVPDTLPTFTSSDPGDDYLIAWAECSRSVSVSGDRDLLELSERIPVDLHSVFFDLLQDSS